MRRGLEEGSGEAQRWRDSTAGRQTRTRALENQVLMRARGTPVMRTRAAFSNSVGSVGHGTEDGVS
jgi:hypothetical protein